MKIPVFKITDVYLLPEICSHCFWIYCDIVVYVIIIYEIMTIGAILLIRYLFLGDMVDCLMDGLQNVTQMRNRTYLESVRNYCGVFSIPPNYVRLKSVDYNIFARIEPRNQTFVQSMDYFLRKEEELFKFRMSSFFLLLTILPLVNIVFIDCL